MPVRHLVVIATLALLAACGGGGDGGGGPAVPRVGSVTVTLTQATILVSTQTTATATVRSTTGEVLTGRAVTWGTTTPDIVEVSSAGVVHGRAAGNGTVSATVDGVSGTASITVQRPPVASVEVTPAAATLSVGAQQQFTAVARDQFGGALAGVVIGWQTSNPSILSIDAAGRGTAVGAGTATVLASAEGRTGQATVTVTPTSTPTSPTITAIAPAVLVPGGQATITGTNFGATPAENAVRVDGVSATVVSASPTQLTVLLPTSGFACNPTRNVAVVVQRGAEAGLRTHPLQSATLRTLAVGQALILGAGESRCNELAQTGGRYILTVTNAATAVGGTASFTLRGAAATALMQPPVAAVAAPRRAAAGPPPGPTIAAALAADEALAARRHAEIMRGSIEAVQAAGGPAAVLPALRRTAAMRSPVAPQTIGDTRTFRIPDIGGFTGGGGNFCTNHFPITARLVYHGARALIYEDVATTTPGGQPTIAGQSDAYYQQVGQEFDAAMWPILVANFGNPLVLDAQLDNNGKIIMLFSPRVNAFTGIAGFVVSCDFLTVQQAPSSNRGEVFYAIVPTRTDNNATVGSGSQTGWLRQMRSTIIHEVKHITSFAARFANGAQVFEESAFEEGSARMAEELWLRASVYNIAWKGNAPYATTVYCDVRPTFPECAGRPLGIFRHFDALYTYLLGSEQRSPLGRLSASVNDATFYASNWSLIRWVIDHYVANEAAFLTAHTQSTAVGIGNLLQPLGRPWDEVLGEWSLAHHLDDAPNVTPANPRLRFPSWNHRDIFGTLAVEPFQGAPYAQPVPAVRPVTFGEFSATVNAMLGGTFSSFELTGTQGARQLVELRAPDGGAPNANLRLNLVRVQ